ncbi:F0F1 ATP synthase subunit delta [Dactylosporangium sp. AC04546]|uniref:F0F1 ATP synthase subunit delta n=1 Tax=Dactylosporangium sp. AC04546 TaxID=2862460 RepID=UPI001EDCF6A8|nr:F0F1 ATP synthase subunit delta [Dactylosporangium sp. AC04546]WVK89494.1 F0F1 ATP synthase subunit delta [Dactylosporangium sp. AC04546]
MMEAINREAYGAAADKLAEFSAGADAQRISAVADETLSVADLLRREPRLRRALADPSRHADDRAELISSILSGKVSDDTVGLLAALAGGRWSGPGALLDGAERLGVDALLAGADRAGDLADVEDELFRFGQVVSGDPRLAGALADATAPAEARSELIGNLLKGKVKTATLRLAQLAVAGFGGRGFDASLSRLVELAAARRDRSVAYVTSAVALTDAEEERLAAKLQQLYGRGVSLKIDVDPRIIGGMRVKVGSDLYDGTVARRLAEARTALAK